MNNLQEACKPVLEYLQSHHPHTFVVVTCDNIYQLSTDEFIPLASVVKYATSEECSAVVKD